MSLESFQHRRRDDLPERCDLARVFFLYNAVKGLSLFGEISLVSLQHCKGTVAFWEDSVSFFTTL